MGKRRLLYLAAVIGCLIFYAAYREWFSWFALIWVLSLPLLSVLVSLPAMLTATVQLRGPARLLLGSTAGITLETRCRLPAPPVRGDFLLTNRLTGEKLRLRHGRDLPTKHCGMLCVTPRYIFVYDYLGLLRLPVRKVPAAAVFVEPAQIPMEVPPALKRRPVNVWRPKPGGGFSENHDLRLYRPGDSLRRIHWKVSAKTGKLIFREAIEPLRDKMLVTMCLYGTPDELDRKLGELLWLSRYLLSKEHPHEIRCVTGQGVHSWSVSDEAGVAAFLHGILQEPAALQPSVPDSSDAYWSHHIGGGTDEA